MALSPKLPLAAVVLSIAACFNQPASAELAAWDQARVTGIAQQLAEACDAWRLALRQQPAAQLGSGVALDEFGLGQKNQVLSEQARALADQLTKGKGYEQTRGLYRAIKELGDDIEVQAQQAELDEPTLDAWARVADLMRQIAPYYDPNALDEPGQGDGA